MVPGVLVWSGTIRPLLVAVKNARPRARLGRFCAIPLTSRRRSYEAMPHVRGRMPGARPRASRASPRRGSGDHPHRLSRPADRHLRAGGQGHARRPQAVARAGQLPGGRPQDRAHRGGYRGKLGHRHRQVPQAHRPRHKIHVLTGVLLANVGQSLVPLIERDQLPTLFLTTPDELTNRKIAKCILRSNFSASQIMHPLGDYASKTLKYRRVATIAMDNAFGHEEIGGFQRVFEDSGGKVVQKLWVPLNALDFAPYLSQVQKDVDAVCAVFVAGQAVRFVKQYGESGLKAKTPLIGTGVMTDESALRGMGDEAVGIVGALLWSPTLQNPANQVFMKLATAKVGRTPAYFTAIMYSSGRWIAEAAQSVNGQVEDREKLVAAIRRATETVPDPRGPIKLDEYGNPTENVYIVRVEKSGGKLVNTVIYTYPSVSQFWTYKPEEFLKTPAYSRDYPPAKP